MIAYHFTRQVRQVLAMAHEEAARLRHEYIGTEHILLGLIRHKDGVAASHRFAVGCGESGRALRPVLFTVQVDCEGGTWFEERFEHAADAIAYIEELSPRRREDGDVPPPQAPG